MSEKSKLKKLDIVIKLVNKLWGDNSNQALGSLMLTLVSEKQMDALIYHLKTQVKERK